MMRIDDRQIRFQRRFLALFRPRGTLKIGAKGAAAKFLGYVELGHVNSPDSDHTDCVRSGVLAAQHSPAMPRCWHEK
jgi:hypothetical protein